MRTRFVVDQRTLSGVPDTTEARRIVVLAGRGTVAA